MHRAVKRAEKPAVTKISGSACAVGKNNKPDERQLGKYFHGRIEKTQYTRQRQRECRAKQSVRKNAKPQKAQGSPALLLTVFFFHFFSNVCRDSKSFFVFLYAVRRVRRCGGSLFFLFSAQKNPSAAIICSEGDFIIIIADRPYGKRVYGFLRLP